jgi:hypothetical protein
MGCLAVLVVAAVQWAVPVPEQAAQELRVKVMQGGTVAQMALPSVLAVAAAVRQQLVEIIQQVRLETAAQVLRLPLQGHQ